MRRRKKRSVNFLELTPVQRVPSEVGENGTVVVLLPRFRNELLVRWLVPLLKNPTVRVKLDALGSFVWKMCDGKTTVSRMASRMTAELGEPALSAQERICKFLISLERSDLVHFEPEVPQPINDEDNVPTTPQL